VEYHQYILSALSALPVPWTPIFANKYLQVLQAYFTQNNFDTTMEDILLNSFKIIVNALPRECWDRALFVCQTIQAKLENDKSAYKIQKIHKFQELIELQKKFI